MLSSLFFLGKKTGFHVVWTLGTSFFLTEVKMQPLKVVSPVLFGHLTLAWETASQVSLRSCSEEVRKEPEYTWIFFFFFCWKKKTCVVTHPMLTANHTEQTSQVSGFNLVILVLFYVWQDAGIRESLNFLLLYRSRGWYIQSPECFLCYSTLNSPQGTLLVGEGGDQLLDPYKTGMVGNIPFFLFLNPSLSNAVVKWDLGEDPSWLVHFPSCERLVPVSLVELRSQCSKRCLRSQDRDPVLQGCGCLVARSCLTLCDPMDCSSPDSSLHWIYQARILEWVAISFSGGSSQPRNQTRISPLY